MSYSFLLCANCDVDSRLDISLMVTESLLILRHVSWI